MKSTLILIFATLAVIATKPLKEECWLLVERLFPGPSFYETGVCIATPLEFFFVFFLPAFTTTLPVVVVCLLCKKYSWQVSLLLPIASLLYAHSDYILRNLIYGGFIILPFYVFFGLSISLFITPLLIWVDRIRMSGRR